MTKSAPILKHLAETSSTRCPCGEAWRVLTGADNDRLSIHFVTISEASEAHYHTRLTEVYIVIEGSGELELDGERRPLTEGSVALIPPGTRHRAVPGPSGLRIVNVVTPPFTSEDEHHD